MMFVKSYNCFINVMYDSQTNQSELKCLLGQSSPAARANRDSSIFAPFLKFRAPNYHLAKKRKERQKSENFGYKRRGNFFRKSFCFVNSFRIIVIWILWIREVFYTVFYPVLMSLSLRTNARTSVVTVNAMHHFFRWFADSNPGFLTNGRHRRIVCLFLVLARYLTS